MARKVLDTILQETRLYVLRRKRLPIQNRTTDPPFGSRYMALTVFEDIGHTGRLPCFLLHGQDWAVPWQNHVLSR
jgi:hypothetical protein